MTNETSELQHICQKIMIYLPEALAQTLNHYKTLQHVDMAADAKSFAAYQAACKAALQHMEYLLRLSSRMGGAATHSESALTHLLEDAQNELDHYNKTEGQNA